MRLKNVPGARKKIEECPFFLNNPNNYKGNFKNLFKNDNPIEIEIGMGKGNFIISMAKKYPEEKFEVTAKEYFELISDYTILTVIENANEQMSIRDLAELQFTTEQIDDFFDYAVKNEIFKEHYRNADFEKLIFDMRNSTFSDLLSLYGFFHGTGVWENNAELLCEKGIPLSELISNREDVYAYLYDKLSGKCCENPSGIAFEIKENVRMGKYKFGRMPKTIESLLATCDVPDWYVESMKKILYLFPKTHLITLLKRDMCEFVMMKAAENANDNI